MLDIFLLDWAAEVSCRVRTGEARPAFAGFTPEARSNCGPIRGSPVPAVDIGIRSPNSSGRTKPRVEGREGGLATRMTVPEGDPACHGAITHLAVRDHTFPLGASS